MKNKNQYPLFKSSLKKGCGGESFLLRKFLPRKNPLNKNKKIPSRKKQKTIEKSEKVWYNIVIYYIMM